MLSGADFQNQMQKSIKAYQGQTPDVEKVDSVEGNHNNNLLVDGDGKGIITTEADETVILIANGDDDILANSDWNQIEAQAGNNIVNVTGNRNSVYTDNGNNDIDISGNENYVHTNHGNNDINFIGNAGGIDTDNGDNTIVLRGAYNKVTMNNGKNDFRATGSYNNIAAENGKDGSNINVKGRNNTISANHGSYGVLVEGVFNNILANANSYNNIAVKGDGEYTDEELAQNGGINNFISVTNGTGVNTDTQNNNLIVSIGDDNYINIKGNADVDLNTFGNRNRVFADNNNSSFIKSGGDNNTIVSDNGDTDVYISGFSVNEKTGEYSLVNEGFGNKVYTGNGNDRIYAKGDRNILSSGSGNDSIVALGNRNTLHSGDGNDAMLSIGDNNNLNAGDGTKRIVFDGDHTNINAGNGTHNIFTLDYAIMNNLNDGAYDQYVDVLENRAYTRMSSEMISSEKGTFEVKNAKTDTKTLSETVVSQSVYSDIINQVAASEQAKFKVTDFSAIDSDGKPKYVLSMANDGKYHVYVHSSGNTYRAAYSSLAGINSNVLTLSDTTIAAAVQSIQSQVTTQKTITTFTQEKILTEYKNTVQDVIKGVNDVNINVGDGLNNMFLNVAEGLNIKGLNNNTQYTNNIFVTGEIVTDERTENKNGEIKIGEVQESSETLDPETNLTPSSKNVNINIASGASKVYDPIIVDFNRDNQLSSRTKMGVDIDNNGTADAAASNGDKMLAMSDLNKNGIIDGSEVFGNETISPFTGQKLNAANGFEALRMIAEEATARGTKCIDEEGNVDLRALQTALKAVGRNIGFISDDNVTQLEDLEHVASINVNQFANFGVKGDDIEVGQAGFYKDTDGNTWQASDFWYKLKK